MIEYIKGYLSSGTTPGEAGNLFWATVYILLVIVGVSVAVLCMNWLERKILAHMQIRLGPMRVGPHGLLQPFADALKLLIKEDIIPHDADKFVFWSAPVVVTMTAFTTFLVVPFGRTHAVTDMNIGVLVHAGCVVAGRAGHHHGGLVVELALPADGLAALERADGLVRNCHGTGDCLGRADDQSADGHRHAEHDRHRGIAGRQHTWFIFKFFPLGFLAFAVFAIAMVAETNRAPFDLPEAESELVADSIPSTAAFAGHCSSWPSTRPCLRCRRLR